MSTFYTSLADHYLRVVVRNPLYHCLSRDAPRPMYDAAKQVIESLEAEDREFIETIYSRAYVNQK